MKLGSFGKDANPVAKVWRSFADNMNNVPIGMSRFAKEFKFFAKKIVSFTNTTSSLADLILKINKMN